jgi:hypothetical protein
MSRFSLASPWTSVGLLLVGLLMALHEHLNPTTVRPTGKWSFLFAPLWDKWGSNGIVAGWVLFGLLVALGTLLLARGR